MSLSRQLLRSGLLAALLVAPAFVLAGCSGLTPVYGERGLTQQRLPLAYAKPVTRLDQIVIQELALRLGRSTQPGSPLVTITSEASSRELTTTDVASPREEQEVTVRVSYTIIVDGVVVGSGTRRATAGYATVGQVLADRSAADDAAERAARAAAETVRLSILADLATPPGPTAAAQ
jgi:LPS-assembly lipoprotein